MKVTESASKYSDLEKMSVEEILEGINREDTSVPTAVHKCIPQIEELVESMVERMKRGGRVFYIGAGTSGRLGVVDASEIPPWKALKTRKMALGGTWRHIILKRKIPL